MTNDNLKTSIAKAYLSLEQKRLKAFFDALDPILTDLQSWQLSEKKNELQITYKCMLQYLTEGVKDPEQHSIYEDLLRLCYRLAHSIEIEWNIKKTAGMYYDKKRALTHSPIDESFASLISRIEETGEKIALTDLLEAGDKRSLCLSELEKEEEVLHAEIFHYIWQNEQLTKEDFDVAEKFLNEEHHSYIVKSLFISAVTLSLQFSFDENKALILLSSCENLHEEIRQRALVGLLLFLRKYDKRLWLYPQISNHLEHLCEDRKFVVDVRNILLQFILSKETEKITRRIKEEFIPEMMKIAPELRNKIKLEELLGETGFDDKNPEWENVYEKLGLNETIQEFSELQMEGADVMHSSFAHLKTYPFFDELSNWFMPFHTDQSIFNDYKEGENREIIDALKKSNFLCHSDKYSFFYSIALMPQAYRKLMIEQFAIESEAMKEIQNEEFAGHRKKSSTVSKQYIQDLYRFYKTHPRKNEFEDIFEEKNDFFQTSTIARIVSDNESRMIIGEYYFKRNSYQEADSVFDCLIEDGIDNDVIYQKKGYCLQMTGDLKTALQAYLKAELLNGNVSWTIKKIAYCYRMLKKPTEALVYYRKAELLTPDNFSVQLSIGHCHLELKNYAEALKYYFKVEYLDKNKERAWRPIAWCSFLTGKYKQAMDYFGKIIERNPDASDYLNCGHTQWAMGNINQAIYFYKQSLNFPGNSIANFTSTFDNDLPELIRSGVNEEDASLILDRLMYDAEIQ